MTLTLTLHAHGTDAADLAYQLRMAANWVENGLTIAETADLSLTVGTCPPDEDAEVFAGRSGPGRSLVEQDTADRIVEALDDLESLRDRLEERAQALEFPPTENLVWMLEIDAINEGLALLFPGGDGHDYRLRATDRYETVRGLYRLANAAAGARFGYATTDD